MEINQIPNPNMPQMPPMSPPPMQPSPPQQTDGLSPVLGIPTTPMKKKSPWFIIIILVILAVGGLAWWYVTYVMEVDVSIVEQTQPNPEAREDAIISGQIQDVDSTNLDSEFQGIDKDLDSL